MGQPTFSVQGQRINILGFAGHKISAATTPFYPCTLKPDTANSTRMNGYGCGSINYLRKGMAGP